MPEPAVADALARLLGAENVQTDADARARAASSWSPLFTKAKQAAGGTLAGEALPDAVVRPADTEAVAAIARWANGAGALLIPIGGASNTVGANAVPDRRPRGGGVAVDLAALDGVRWDEESLLVHAGAGVNLGALEAQLNAHGYTLGHLPQSLNLATVGGSVATNAVGLLSGRYGRQRDLTAGLEAVLPTGEVVRTGPGAAANAAFDLHDLLIGSEGTLALITEATLRMRPMPAVRAWTAFTFPTFGDGVDALRLVYRSDSRPACARLLDPDAARAPLEAAGVSDTAALLLLAFEGDELVQTGPYQVAYAVCQRAGGAEQSPDIGEAWFDRVRQQTTAFAPNARAGGLADVLSLCAPWSALKRVDESVRHALEPLVTARESQIGHADPAGAALDIAFEAQAEPATPDAAVALYQRLTDAALTAAQDAGGGIAHHYGIGRTRAAAFARERGLAGMAALRAIKAALDPNGVLRPI